MSNEKDRFPKGRMSACADSALRAEMKRVESMTVEERITAALALGKRLATARVARRGE
jgi:hypothetical protein